MTTETQPAATYTQEAVLACILLPLLATSLAILGGYLIRRWQRGDDTEFLAFGALSILAAVTTTAGLWWGMYPWKAEYHEWRPVTGVVATVDSRLTANTSGGMEDKFVVTLTDNPGQQYGVLDTRAASLRPGDHLDITCVRRWQWSGTHGYDCNFVQMGGGAR